MDDKNKIIETLKNQLQHLDFVHAMWLEGSLAEKDNDEYSDLDIWLSVNDDMLRNIFDDVEKALETIAPIDFKLVLKPSGELGHNVYHLAGMSEFLTLDINTQKFSRDVVLREEIDLYEIIFDKTGIIRTMPRESINFKKDEELAELIKFIDYTALSKKECFTWQKNGIARVLQEYPSARLGIFTKKIWHFRKSRFWFQALL